jgi:perosamine synthetase
MDEWKIPFYKIYTDDEDINLITKIVKRGNRWALGPEIEEFENELKNYVGTDYCVTLNSGTSALHSALLAYQIGSSDEVIIPSFTFIATANSVLFVNSKPIFAEIEDVNLGLDPKDVQSKITPSTKAIIPVDYAGLPCKILEIKKITEDNEIQIIEDAAESLGASINGKKVGSLTETAIFSFCGNKVLTTGEGGALVTNSKLIFEKAKLLRSHGRVEKTNYLEDARTSDYVSLGYNWRMSSFTASLGLTQLKKLDKMIKKRQENAKYLNSCFSKIREISLPIPPDGYEHVYQMYTIRLSNKEMRDKLHEFLLNKKIFSKVYFNPIHTTDYYKEKFGEQKISLPTTEKICKQVLTLPLYPNMTLEEKDYLTSSVIEFFENN